MLKNPLKLNGKCEMEFSVTQQKTYLPTCIVSVVRF